MKNGRFGWQLCLALVALCLWVGMAREHTFERGNARSGVKAAVMDQNVPDKFETATFALG